ncbi:MAG: HAMP domain-containing sensor histidine kinase [Pseudomonadota bacterium]
MNANLNFDPSIPLAEAEGETDELIYRLSHDLRASVRALQELPTWIAEDLDTANIHLPKPTGRHLELISSHAVRLDLMLTGLLEHSRIGRMQAIAAVKPASVFDGVVEDLGLPDGAKLNARIDKGSVQMGDTDLARIFSILLVNAVRFHPEKSPRIDVVAGPANDREWMIEVSDNGPGIPKPQRDFVLRPMTKLVSRDVDPGAGMGLAILKKIAETYGGSVTIGDTKTGKGTKVRVLLSVN